MFLDIFRQDHEPLISIEIKGKFTSMTDQNLL
jgi:hypothetical protein